MPELSGRNSSALDAIRGTLSDGILSGRFVCDRRWGGGKSTCFGFFFFYTGHILSNVLYIYIHSD